MNDAIQSQLMRSRYRFLAPYQGHFITCSIVQWLPVFTSAQCCDLLLESLEYCRANMGLRVFAWVIMSNHFHAVVSGGEVSQTVASLKKFTARTLLTQIEAEGRSWLLHQLAYYRASYKTRSEHQVWQEGSHPQAITSDEMLAQKITYIECNPVKAGYVAAPEHWRYSSAHEWLPGGSPVFRCDDQRGSWE